MSVLRGMLIPLQERELEKVNAFYLQKEAEVSANSLSELERSEDRGFTGSTPINKLRRPLLSWLAFRPGPPILASLG